MGIYELLRFLQISIHALREEGDSGCRFCSCRTFYFYPRPPRGGRPIRDVLELCIVGISIHALREEGDLDLGQVSLPDEISIHALREEGDSKNRDKISIFL